MNYRSMAPFTTSSTNNSVLSPVSAITMIMKDESETTETPTTASEEQEETIHRVGSHQSLTLYLYCPQPGYALVCHDNHPTRTSPSCFQKVAKRLGDPKCPTEMKFLLCLQQDLGDDQDVGQFRQDHDVQSQTLTYVLYQCGGDWKELGRMTASRDVDHTASLRAFCIDTKDQIDNDHQTLNEKLVEQETHFKVNRLLSYLDETRNKNGKNKQGWKLNDSFKCYLTLGNHDIVLVAAKTGRCQFLAYLGREQMQTCNDDIDDNQDDVEMLEQLLQWNWQHPQGMDGFMIGMEEKTLRFTLESTLQIVQERSNEETFCDWCQRFETALDVAVDKIQHFRKGQEEKRRKNEQKLTAIQLRELRVSKYQSTTNNDKSESDNGSDSEEESIPLIHCVYCRKDFASRGQYHNHLNSKKHKKSRRNFETKYGTTIEEENEDLQHGRPDDDSTKNQVRKPKRKMILGGTSERRAFLKHRARLREMIQCDKQERQQNGGRLPHRLGTLGYRPTGTLYESSDESDSAMGITDTK